MLWCIIPLFARRFSEELPQVLELDWRAPFIYRPPTCFGRGTGRLATTSSDCCCRRLWCLRFQDRCCRGPRCRARGEALLAYWLHGSRLTLAIVAPPSM